jgi:hypothetical protein
MSDLGAVVASYISNLHDMAQRARNFGYNLELQRQADEAAMNRVITTAMAELQRQQATAKATAQNSFLQAILGGSVDPSTASMVLEAMSNRGDISPEYVQPLQTALSGQAEYSKQRASAMAKVFGDIYEAKGIPLPQGGVENIATTLSLLPPAEQEKIAKLLTPRTGTTVNVGTGGKLEFEAAKAGAKQAAIEAQKALSKQIEGHISAYRDLPENVKLFGDDRVTPNLDASAIQQIEANFRGFRGNELYNKILTTINDPESNKDRALADLMNTAATAINFFKTSGQFKGSMTNYEDQTIMSFGTGKFSTADGLTALVLSGKARVKQAKQLHDLALDIDVLRHAISNGVADPSARYELQSKIKAFNDLSQKAPYDFLTGDQQAWLRNFYSKLNKAETGQSGQIGQSAQGVQSGQQGGQGEQQSQPTRGGNLINEDNFQSHSKEFLLGVTGAKDIGQAKKLFLSSMPEVITTNNKAVQEVIGGDRVNLKDFMLSEDIPDEKKVKLLAIILKNLHNQKVPADKRRPYTSADYEALADYWLNFLTAHLAKQHGK